MKTTYPTHPMRDFNEIPAKEFERKFPLPLFVNKNEENPNNLGSMLSETI